MSKGVRAAASFIAFRSWISPSGSLEVGQFFDGDAQPLARRLSGDAMLVSPVLERVGYRYVNGHLGLEAGQESFTFFIHAGLSIVHAVVHGAESEIDRRLADEEGAPRIRVEREPTVTVVGPSARLGLIIYF